MRRVLVGIMLLVTLAGCGSWKGTSEVQLQDGTRLHCRGLTFSRPELICQTAQGDISVAWANVAGYATGSYSSP